MYIYAYVYIYMYNHEASIESTQESTERQGGTMASLRDFDLNKCFLIVLLCATLLFSAGEFPSLKPERLRDSRSYVMIRSSTLLDRVNSYIYILHMFSSKIHSSRTLDLKLSLLSTLKFLDPSMSQTLVE